MNLKRHIILTLKDSIRIYLNKRRIAARTSDCTNNVTKAGANIYELSNLQRQEILEYYSKYINPTNFNLAFHAFYYGKTGNHFANYIPDDLHYCYIDPYLNDWNLARYLDNKCHYSFLFPEAKQPDVIACRINGYWTNSNSCFINIDQVLCNIAMEQEVVIKQATNSSGGHGVFFIENTTDKSAVLNCIDAINTDIIIQKAIKQHRILNEINSTSINTIRIITLLYNNEINVLSSILRSGINGSRVDNASSGGITIGILESGQLKDVAYTAQGKRFERHPSSGISFANYTIPAYDKAITLVKQLQPKLPHFRLVSWDIAISEEEEPILIEANLCYGELDFHQLNNGPLFGDFTDAILEEVFCKGGKAHVESMPFLIID